MYKVLIVDDHESMCDALNITLTNTGEFTVVSSLASAADADVFCSQLKPDLVFMDVCTEGGASGLDAVKKIRENYPNIKIIVMSGFDEISYAPRAKEAGAHAFVLKSKSLNFFAGTASAVMQGEARWPEPKTIPVPKGEAPLTRKEIEVLRLVCQNMTNKEIANELFISTDTVKYRKANMLAKTGFARAIDLACYMIDNGWIKPMY